MERRDFLRSCGTCALSASVARALAGGTQSIMQVAVTAPQNQQRKINDQQHHDHSQ